ncbi:DUF2799 domain-containing protein [Alishewanella longhuensis]
MYKHKVTAVLVSVLLTLSGCATLDQAGCLNADWRTLGFEDGLKGRNESHIRHYRQDCAKHGVTPDLDSYRAGHYEGSVQFCTAKNGFLQGMENLTYQNSCPAEFTDAFMLGYRDGQSVYQARSTLDNARVELRQLTSDITDLEKQISALNEKLVADGLSREQRVSIRDELAKSNEALGKAKLTRDELTAAIIVFQRELDRLNAYAPRY